MRETVNHCPSFCEHLLIKKNDTPQYWKYSILKRECEPVDITQAICKLCARVMPVKKSQTPVTTESESKN